MNRPVGTHAQPLLALLILVLTLAGVASITVLPLWRAAEGYDDAIAQLRERLATQTRMAAAGSGLQPRLAELERGLASDARYLKSTSPTLAGAELQGIVKRVILSKRGEVLSTQVVGGERERRSRRVTLAVTMRATLEQTVEIFYLLETGNPYLFIDNLGVRSRSTPRAKTSAAAAATAGPVPLDIEFELTGYMRGGHT